MRKRKRMEKKKTNGEKENKSRKIKHMERQKTNREKETKDWKNRRTRNFEMLLKY